MAKLAKPGKTEIY